MSDNTKVLDSGFVTLTYLEFYSGVGGWTMALEEACRRINKSSLVAGPTEFILVPKRLAAFDHSELCNHVLDHNFPELDMVEKKHVGVINGENFSTKDDNTRAKAKKKPRDPKKPVAIERVVKEQLEKYNATVWMMSPPCQPHTRQHCNQTEEIQDPRSKSFLHLCEIIREMKHDKLPKIIMLENVIGFENSRSCKIWRQALSSRKYSVGHFHLNPVQVGIPNDRPRYYCVAALNGTNHTRSWSLNNETDVSIRRVSFHEDLQLEIENENRLEAEPVIRTNIRPLGVHEESRVGVGELAPISQFLDSYHGQESTENDQQIKSVDSSTRSSLLVPKKILESSSSWCFDIITPLDRRSSCFTSSYGKFVRGTGSVLYTGNNTEGNKEISSECDKLDADNTTCKKKPRLSLLDATERFKLVCPSERTFDKNWSNGFDLYNNLRYFSGTEIARLLGFPVLLPAQERNEELDFGVRTFSFPPNCTIKQQWKLLGNSLNVKVAAKIAETGIRSYFNESGKVAIYHRQT